MNIATFPVEKLIHIVSSLIETMLHANNKIPTTQITCFHSRAVPNISIKSYITRIHKFAPFSNEALLSILVYFDRISKIDPTLTINSYNIHRLLITSIVIAAKFTSDIYYANSRYAKVGGLPLQELNRLELEFLYLIQFQLHITLQDLQEYADQLLSMSITTTSTTATTTTNTPTTVGTTSCKVEHRTRTKISLPLTPPYHPYKIPKKKMGLISPKDS